MPCTCSHRTHVGVINGMFCKTGWLCEYSAGEALKGALKRCLEVQEFYLCSAFKRMSISFMCWLNSLSVLWWFMDLHAKGDLWRGFRKNLHGFQPRVQRECLYFLKRLLNKTEKVAASVAICVWNTRWQQEGSSCNQKHSGSFS